MNSPSKELAPTATPNVGLAPLRPIVSPKDLIDRQTETTRFIKAALEQGVDFGRLPGTDTETLFKPGADKLCTAFGLVPEFEMLESEVDHDRVVRWIKRQKNRKTGEFYVREGESFGAYRYRYKCQLIHGDRPRGSGEGICSTYESKYIESPRDAEHTVSSMAQKRAHIQAVIRTLGLASVFKGEDENNAPEVYRDAPEQRERLFQLLTERRIAVEVHDAVARELVGKNTVLQEVDAALRRVQAAHTQPPRGDAVE